MKSYTLRPDTFTLNFNFTLSGTPAFDALLGSFFNTLRRDKTLARKEALDANREHLNFQGRALDLLEVYLTRQPGHSSTLELVVPVLRAVRGYDRFSPPEKLRQETSNFVRRLVALCRGKLCKPKNTPQSPASLLVEAGEDTEEALEAVWGELVGTLKTLREVGLEAAVGRRANPVVVELSTLGLLYILRTVTAAGKSSAAATGGAGGAASAAKGGKKGGKKGGAAAVPAPQSSGRALLSAAHPERITQISATFAPLLRAVMCQKGTAFNVTSVEMFVNRYPIMVRACVERRGETTCVERSVCVCVCVCVFM